MIKYVKKYWYFALLAPIFMIGEVVMDLLQPQLMKVIVDEGIKGINNNGIGDVSLVIRTGLIMIGLVIVGGISGRLSVVFANLCSQNVANDLRRDCFKRVMYLSFEQTDDFSTGSLVTRITNDVTQIQSLTGMMIRMFVRTFMLFGGGIFCMLSLDITFGIVVACSMPLVVIFVFVFIGKASPKFKVLQKKMDVLNSILQENVSGARVVKAYVKEDYEKERFSKANRELLLTQLYVSKLFSFMGPVTNIILNISVVAIIYIGGINVSNNTGLTTGEIMAAITYVSQILMSILNMANMFQSISRAKISSVRLNEVLRSLPVICDGKYDQETPIKGKIEFRNVSFAYPDSPNVSVLDNINLKVEPGQTIGILGSTGSGKSSLVNLIPRFYDSNEGTIFIDDIDVKEYKVKTLRNKISIALQKSELFSKTIEENISWGNLNACSDEVIEAAKTAQAYDFIIEKEDGFNTIVAEKGMSLSGGQKQRLAIARAILKPAEILILDDATSALDLKTEAKLYDALNKNYRDLTKIIIAQRIASIKHSDKIYVLDRGNIVAEGTHEELLKNSSIYQEIYESQLKTGGNVYAE